MDFEIVKLCEMDASLDASRDLAALERPLTPTSAQAALAVSREAAFALLPKSDGARFLLTRAMAQLYHGRKTSRESTFALRILETRSLCIMGEEVHQRSHALCESWQRK